MKNFFKFFRKEEKKEEVKQEARPRFEVKTVSDAEIIIEFYDREPFVTRVESRVIFGVFYPWETTSTPIHEGIRIARDLIKSDDRFIKVYDEFFNINSVKRIKTNKIPVSFVIDTLERTYKKEDLKL